MMCLLRWEVLVLELVRELLVLLLLLAQLRFDIPMLQSRRLWRASCVSLLEAWLRFIVLVDVIAMDVVFEKRLVKSFYLQ